MLRRPVLAPADGWPLTGGRPLLFWGWAQSFCVELVFDQGARRSAIPSASGACDDCRMANRGTSILFTAAGRRVSLVRQFKAALRTLGDPGRCVTADTSPTAPAHQAGDKALRIPRCDAPDFIDQLLAICVQEHVRLLVPLIDTELPVLAAHRHRFAEQGVTVLVSDPATIAIGNDKRATGAFFAANGFRSPQIYSTEALPFVDASAFPLFVKPPDGSASIGARRIDTAHELAVHMAEQPNLMVQDCITGVEHTIDVWVDLAGQAQCAVPRRRLEVRAGEVSKAVTVRNPAMIDAALAVAQALPGARGCLTLQVFLTPKARQLDDVLTFIEINPRFGGGFPLSVHAGAHFPLWALQEIRGEQPDYAAGQAFRDGLMMLRYDDELIVDAASLGWTP
jgi:carbamoyl-phosphate synthase large subunit